MSLKNSRIKTITSPFPTIILFGRTNVGKSTLFNKLMGKSQAMVSKIPGTTRDSNVGTVEWQGPAPRFSGAGQGRQFQLVDTGGILNTKFLRGKSKLKKIGPAPVLWSEANIDNLVQLRVKEHIKQASLILFLVDTKQGLVEQDREMSILLKRLIGKKTPILLVANKADTQKQRNNTAEFYKLSLGDPIPVSAANGSGTGDLLDIIVKKLPSLKSSAKEYEQTKIAILGRPNVGKSSLLNAIIGEEKVIVSALPHTTREPKDLSVKYKDYYFTFIDTAGLVKKKSKVTKNELIKLGIIKSLATIKQADIALLILDISEAISHQDTKIADEILKQNVSLIIVANKWDKIDNKNTREFNRYINSKLSFITWAPIIFLSAKNQAKIPQLLQMIIEVKEARSKTIEQDELDQFLTSAVRHTAPLADTKVRGIIKKKLRRPQLIKLTQTRTNPPEFSLQIKSKFGLKENYVKYLENRLREKFNLVGTPVTIKVK